MMCKVAFVALAMVAFVGASVLEETQTKAITQLAENVIADFEKDIQKTIKAHKVDAAFENLKKQADSRDVDKEMAKLEKELNKRLSDRRLSDAAKTCLQEQHLKAKGIAEATRAALKACVEDKRDEAATVRQNVADGLIETRNNAVEYRKRAKECIRMIPNFKDANECLMQIASDARQCISKLGKILRGAISDLRHLAGDIARCARDAIKVFRQGIKQVRDDSWQCLKLKDETM